MKNTDIYTNNDEISNENVDIKKLLIKLENISNEKEKDIFIKNYSKIKNDIKIIDDIFNDDTINYDDLKDKSINELLKLLESFENKIFNSEPLDAYELKFLMTISNILEIKINDDTMEIIEIK